MNSLCALEPSSKKRRIGGKIGGKCASPMSWTNEASKEI